MKKMRFFFDSDRLPSIYQGRCRKNMKEILATWLETWTPSSQSPYYYLPGYTFKSGLHLQELVYLTSNLPRILSTPTIKFTFSNQAQSLHSNFQNLFSIILHLILYNNYKIYNTIFKTICHQ
jgi:hypothetical protein